MDQERILILEDTENDACLIRLELQRGGLNFVDKTVINEPAFSEAIRTFRPTVILSDFKLPGFDALDALALARRHCPEVPFIVVSGVLGEEVAVETLQKGATDYVLKDRLFRLVPSLRRALQERTARLQQLQAEAKYKSIFENAIEGIFQTTPEGKYLSANPALARMLGYASPEELINSVADVANQICVEPATRTRLKEMLERDGFVRDFENEVVRKDGKRIWVSVNARVVRDAAGKVLYYEGTSAEITRRKLAEAQLATLGHAIEGASEFICITDQSNRFTFVNQAFLKAYGYSAEEILGKRADCLYSRSNPPGLYEQILESTLAGGWAGDLFNCRKDGSEFPISLSTSRIHDAQGRTLGLVGVARDISERKKAERQRNAFSLLGHRLSAAATTEQAARIILNVASELFGWDAGYVHLYSEADDRIVPVLTMDTVGGRRIEVSSDSFTVDPSPLMRRVMEGGAQLLDGPEDSARPVPLVPFGDKVRPSASMMYVPIQSGAGVLGLLSIQSYTRRAYSPADLTLLQTMANYCGAALQRISVAASLRDSERKLRLIAENATDVIFAFDMQRRPIYVNHAVEKLTGYTVAEIQQRGFVNWIYSEDEERMLALWEGLFSGQGYSGVEFRLVTKTGEVKWSSSSWGPLLDETGQQVGVQGCERDITDRKELEREVLEASANERRRVGHELHDGLGQYLAGIAFKAKALEHLLAGESLTQREEAKELADLIGNAISQTRTLARGLDPVEVETIGLLAALENLLSETGKFFNVQCRLNCSRGTLPIDPQASLALYRIVQESIHNAITHGDARQIELNLNAENKQLELSIRDNGAGFDASVPKNCGMGLRVMQYRARSLGGTLKVESRPGQGTMVICALPISFPAQAAPPNPNGFELLTRKLGPRQALPEPELAPTAAGS